MKTAVILYIVISFGGQPTIFGTKEYDSPVACQVEAAEIIEDIKAEFADNESVTVEASCGDDPVVEPMEG